jgi:hypothetical protein
MDFENNAKASRPSKSPYLSVPADGSCPGQGAVFRIRKYFLRIRIRGSVILNYVTDGNIMYLTDASRFLISCVIQHYAPVVGPGFSSFTFT